MSKYGGKKLTGKHPLAYMGVEPTTPNQMVSLSRAPTAADYIGYNIGTIWYNTDAITRIASEVWLLVGLSPKGTATWVKIYPTAGTGTVLDVAASLPLTISGTAAIHPQVDLANGVDGSVLISDTVTGHPTWHTISDGNGIAVTSAAGSITLDTDIDFQGTGGGTANMVGGIIKFAGAGGAVVTAAGDTVTITAGGGGGGIVNTVQAGDNINVDASTPTDPIVNLDTSILQPFTNAAGTEGVYALGVTSYTADRFLHAYGTNNTFLGRLSGNLTLTTAANNTGAGAGSLTALTQGTDNATYGVLSGTSITQGSYNSFYGSRSASNIAASFGNSGFGYQVFNGLTTSVGSNSAFGYQSLAGITTGQLNSAFGYQAGAAHLTSDSSCIDIGNVGVAGDSNVIRIGEDGSGLGQQDRTYLAGIYNTGLLATSRITMVNNLHQLSAVTLLPIANGGTNNNTFTTDTLTYYNGTSIVSFPNSINPGWVLTATAGAPAWTNPAGGGTVTGVTATAPLQVTPSASPAPNVSFIPDTAGKVLIATATTTPVWNFLTGGNGISITSASGSVTIATSASYVTDSGTANPVAGVINVLGGAAIKTKTTAANTIVIDDTLTINTQNASYVLTLTDAGKFIRMNVGTANTVTVPAEATVDFPVGTQIVIMQYGAGTTSVVAAAGVTIYSPGSLVTCAEENSMLALVKIGVESWALGGDLA